MSTRNIKNTPTTGERKSVNRDSAAYRSVVSDAAAEAASEAFRRFVALKDELYRRLRVTNVFAFSGIAIGALALLVSIGYSLFVQSQLNDYTAKLEASEKSVEELRESIKALQVDTGTDEDKAIQQDNKTSEPSAQQDNSTATE